jgi:hypothetical protein
MTTARYRLPDRKFEPNRKKTEEKPYLDIGWAEGVLSDNRPYRVEFWAEDQISMLTFFFQADGLNQSTREEFKHLLEEEGLVEFTNEKWFVSPGKISEPDGTEFWSINVVLGDEDGLFCTSPIVIQSYKTLP